MERIGKLRASIAHSFRETDRSLSLIDQAKNRILYPSSEDFESQMDKGSALAIAGTIGGIEGVARKFTIPMGVFGLVGASASLDIYRSNAMFFSDTMILIRQRSMRTVDLSEALRIKKGEVIGGLHVFGVDGYKHSAELSELQRGRRMLRDTGEGFARLAAACEDGDPIVSDFSVFYGASDIVSPSLAERFGLHWREYRGSKSDSDKLRSDIHRSRAALGPNGSKVGKLYEYWITKDELREKSDSILENAMSLGAVLTIGEDKIRTHDTISSKVRQVLARNTPAPQL